MIDSFTTIGKLSKTFGTKGRLKYTVEDKFLDLVDKGTFIFLDQKGSYVPFLITHIDNISLALEWINTPEDAQSLVNSGMYLPTDQIPEDLLEIAFPTFETFLLYDQEDQLVGQIIKVEEFPSQVMFHVQRNDQVILIPFHADNYISHESNTLKIYLADGLLEI